MRWLYLSLLLAVFGLAMVVSASWPSAAQNKQLTTFELGLLVTTAVTPRTPPVQTPASSTYCPNSPLTRADAAKFILLAKHGRTYTPPAATGIFSDVPLSNPDASWIEQLAKEGIARGCSSTNDGSKQYCPAMPLTREEMAVFVLRSIHGSTYTPPAATGVFSDVPKDDQFAPWIEQLAKEGISKGTSLGPPPTYSPKQSVMRGEMAMFMLRSIHGGNYTPPPIAGTMVLAHNPGALSPQPQLPRGQSEINTQVPGLGEVTLRYCKAYADVSSDDVRAHWIEQLAKEGISVGCGGPPPTTCETPTPASTQNSSTECAEDVRKEVQRLNRGGGAAQ